MNLRQPLRNQEGAKSGGLNFRPTDGDLIKIIGVPICGVHHFFVKKKERREMRRTIKKYEVLFDRKLDGKKKEKNVCSSDYFGGYVMAENEHMAVVSVFDWLEEELEDKHIDFRRTYKNIYVNGKIAYGNFRVKEMEDKGDGYQIREAA